MKLTRHFLPLFAAPIFLLSSCVSGDEPTPAPNPVPSPLEEAKRTVLVYAVASNNLYYDWLSDLDEMIKGADSVSGLGSDVQLAVYSVIPKAENATLSVLSKKDGNWEMTEIKSYDRSLFSTDPKRIGEVISDTKELVPAENYGLIFWSHATGWTPSFSDHTMTPPEPSETKRAFGQDNYNPDGTYQYLDQCDIIELADAIPADTFDYVWFDCCYMGAIEVAYQMASKTQTMVAYPSEVWSEGLPYHIVLPYIAAETPDLEWGARKVSEYFSDSGKAFTIGVYDLTAPELKELAPLFGEIVSVDPYAPISSTQKYSRNPYGPFYDLRHLAYQALYNINSGVLDVIDFDEMLGKVVVYADCSERSFLGSFWNRDIYCGLSAHYPSLETDSEAEHYYRTTAWGKAVTDAMMKKQETNE